MRWTGVTWAYAPSSPPPQCSSSSGLEAPSAEGCSTPSNSLCLSHRETTDGGGVGSLGRQQAASTRGSTLAGCAEPPSSPVPLPSLLFLSVLPTPPPSVSQRPLQSAFPQTLPLTPSPPLPPRASRRAQPFPPLPAPKRTLCFLHSAELLSIFYIPLSSRTRTQASCLRTAQPTAAGRVAGWREASGPGSPA